MVMLPDALMFVSPLSSTVIALPLIVIDPSFFIEMLADPVVMVIESPAVMLKLLVMEIVSSLPMLVVRPPVTDRLSSAPTLMLAAEPTVTV